MSSVFFDPATSAGNNAGARKPATPANAAVGGLSFDALLAKHQSSYEADADLRNDKSVSGRDYDRDRDYDDFRKDDRDFETDKSLKTEKPDDDLDRRVEEDSAFEDSSEKDRDDTASGEDEHEDSGSDHAVAAAQTDSKADTTGTAASGDDAVAAASGPAASGNNTNASTAATSSAASADTQKAAPQTAQAAASQQASASQKAAATNTVEGKQPAGGNATASTSATASVTNAGLVSQSNTALTSGAAVVTLQSVDPKAAAPAGTAMANDPLSVPQAEGDLEGEAAPKPANTAAATAKPRPVGETGQPATAQAANVNTTAAQTQTGPAAMSSANAALPAAASESPAGVSATQAAGGTPSFTSLTPVGGITQTANATGAGAAASGNASAAAATPGNQVAVEIRKGIAAGKDKITIKLNPAELGKIDVKMELANDGTLRASIAVEKPETLDMLQKDIRGLERALQNAGLQADSGSLNFSLRGEGGSQSNDFETASNAGSGTPGDETGAQDAAEESEPARRSSHDGALDISV